MQYNKKTIGNNIFLFSYIYMKRVNGLYFFLMYKPTACVMINTLELFPYFFLILIRFKCKHNSFFSIRDHLHFYLSLQDYLPFKTDKSVPFMQSSMKTTYIFPILCTKFKLNFSFAVKLSSNFLQLKYLQILRKLYSIFFVLSTDLLWNRYHFAIPVFALIFFQLHVLARKPNLEKK